MRDLRSLLQVLADLRPDRIFHLASLSSTDSSHNMACAFMDTNLMGTVNLLEALRELKLRPRVLVATSAEAYGLVYSDELPVKETAVFRPLSPFGVSKAAQDLLGFQYFKCSMACRS
ncbi:MAG: GDP-mannose 4,6-dehydratase [Candidatus Saccharicenans sp.]|nr:GDP-mannose 4,6-dehydratase [Candidatus Saccharicenans sp.]